MKPYKIFPSEKKTVKDRVSGAEVTQLTAYLGHSHHSYLRIMDGMTITGNYCLPLTEIMQEIFSVLTSKAGRYPS